MTNLESFYVRENIEIALQNAIDDGTIRKIDDSEKADFITDCAETIGYKSEMFEDYSPDFDSETYDMAKLYNYLV